MRGAVISYADKVRSFSTNARLFLLSTALGSLQSGILQVVLALYVVALDHGRDFLGVMTGLGALVTGIASLPAAAVARATGHRKALLVGTAIAASGALGISLSSARTWLLLFQGILGAGTAFIFVNTAPFLAENSSDTERTYLFSVNGTMLLAVAVVGNSLGGTLPNAFGLAVPGWASSSPAAFRAAMLVGVAFIAASALPLLSMREAQHQGGGAASEGPALAGEWSPGRVSGADCARGSEGVRCRAARGARSGRHRLRLMGQFVTTSAVTSLGAGMMVPFLSVFLADKGASSSFIGAVFAGSMVMTTLGTVVAPVLAERWGKVKTVALTQIASTPFLVAMALSGNLLLAVPAMLVRSALMNMSAPVDGSFSMEAVDASDRAVLSSLRGMSWNLAWAGGSVLGGMMIERSGYAAPFLVTAILYLASALLYVLFFSKLDSRRSGQAGQSPQKGRSGRSGRSGRRGPGGPSDHTGRAGRAGYTGHAGAAPRGRRGEWLRSQ